MHGSNARARVIERSCLALMERFRSTFGSAAAGRPSTSSTIAINTGFPQLRKIHSDPPLFLVPDFLSAEECDRLIAASDGRLQDAHVVGKGDGQTNSFGYVQGKTPGRTSRTCTLAKEEVGFLVEKAEVRCKRDLATPRERETHPASRLSAS